MLNIYFLSAAGYGKDVRLESSKDLPKIEELKWDLGLRPTAYQGYFNFISSW